MIKQQYGQVLPLGLVVLALTIMGIFVLYNTGQVATDKMKLANSADAAAYSGALLQARALNFQAYSNRAMVANQVSIAQAVTLDSWVTYGAVSSENIATVLKPIPVINVLAQGVQTGLRQVEKVVSPISQALLSVVNTVNRGLSISQEAMYMSTFVATPEVIRTVVAETDERFTADTAYSGIGMVEYLTDLENFTTGYSSDDVGVMSDRVAMINESRDSFTEERNWKFFKNFWFYSTPILRHRIYREGKTELIQVARDGELNWEWKAKDTLSLHNRLWRWRGTKRYEIPIGWGESFANSSQSHRTIDPTACTTAQSFSSSADCSRLLGMNRNAEMLADTGVRSPVSGLKTNSALTGYSGLQNFRSLSNQSLDAGSPTVRLKIEVSMPIAASRTSDQTELGDSFRSPSMALGNVLSSISTAEVYYKRPDMKHDSDIEPANSYNPYWAARLSPNTIEDKLLATSFRSDAATSPPRIDLDNAAGIHAVYDHGESSTLPTYQESAIDHAGLDEALSVYSIEAQDFTQELINEELNQVLAESVRQILTGVAGEAPASLNSISQLSQENLSRATNTTVQDLTDSGAGNVYDQVIEEAERLAQELNDEFIRIRTVVSDDFDLAHQESIRVLDEQLADINAEVARLRGEIENGSHNEDSLRELQRQIDSNQREAQRLTVGNKDILARQLMDIVSEATDLYVMRYSEALYTVEEWLRQETEQISLPWTELLDDE